MTEEFYLYGLNRGANHEVATATCNIGGRGGDWFHAKITGDNETKEALWNYCKDNWKDEKTAVVEHEGYSTGGTPINPVLLHIKEK